MLRCGLVSAVAGVSNRDTSGHARRTHLLGKGDGDPRLLCARRVPDEDASDYPLEGNLLLGADDIVTEHPLSTPFGNTFRLGAAVLGPPVEKTAMTLGGVEICAQK
jgi:hypothetical protein